MKYIVAILLIAGMGYLANNNSDIKTYGSHYVIQNGKVYSQDSNWTKKNSFTINEKYHLKWGGRLSGSTTVTVIIVLGIVGYLLPSIRK